MVESLLCYRSWSRSKMDRLRNTGHESSFARFQIKLPDLKLINLIRIRHLGLQKLKKKKNYEYFFRSLNVVFCGGGGGNSRTFIP